MLHRSDIIDTAKTYICKDRNATHGEPEDNFANIAMLWDGYFQARFGAEFHLETRDVAVLMTLFKIARSVNNPANPDNWIDGVGYMACAGEVAIKAHTPKDPGLVIQTTMRTNPILNTNPFLNMAALDGPEPEINPLTKRPYTEPAEVAHGQD